MNLRASVIFLMLALVTAGQVSGLETDQFTIPPRPLKDIGPTLDAHVLGILRQTAEAANARRAEMLCRARANPFPPFRRFFNDRAAEVLTPDYFARRLYEAIG